MKSRTSCNIHKAILYHFDHFGARTFNVVDFPVLEGGRVLGGVAVAARERVVAALRPDVGVESEPGRKYLIVEVLSYNSPYKNPPNKRILDEEEERRNRSSQPGGPSG
jgi:hypothetical protein